MKFEIRENINSDETEEMNFDEVDYFKLKSEYMRSGYYLKVYTGGQPNPKKNLNDVSKSGYVLLKDNSSTVVKRIKEAIKDRFKLGKFTPSYKIRIDYNGSQLHFGDETCDVEGCDKHPKDIHWDKYLGDGVKLCEEHYEEVDDKTNTTPASKKIREKEV